MYIEEDAPFWGRCCSFCCPWSRKTKYSVYEGYNEETKEGTKLVMTHEKERTCGSNMFCLDGRLPLCCYLPYSETKDYNGNVLGITRYRCDCCLFVPKFSVYDEHNEETYYIRPNTCCFDCCVECRCYR
eukprot:UN00088